MAEYETLRSNIASYSDADQARYVELLQSVCETETSPEIRRQIALVLSEVSHRDDALAGIEKLSRDSNAKVRLAVATHLVKAPVGQATETLLAMAASDKDENVRNMATSSLASHQTDEVRAFLAKQLDARQPATQFAAYQALAKQTGKNFGGDVSKMRAFVGGEDVEEVAPSFWASPIDYFFTR